MPSLNKITEKSEKYIRNYWKAISEYWVSPKGYDPKEMQKILEKYELGNTSIFSPYNRYIPLFNWNYDLLQINECYKKLIKV